MPVHIKEFSRKTNNFDSKEYLKKSKDREQPRKNFLGKKKKRNNGKREEFRPPDFTIIR